MNKPCNEKNESENLDPFHDAPDYIKQGLINVKNMEHVEPPPPPPVIYPEPTLAQKIHNLIDFAKEVARDKIDGKDVIISEDLFKKRFNICISCDYVSKDKSICTACGCVINVKARFNSASCPKGYW